MGPDLLQVEPPDGTDTDKVGDGFKIHLDPVTPLPLLQNKFFILNHQLGHRLIRVQVNRKIDLKIWVHILQLSTCSAATDLA